MLVFCCQFYGRVKIHIYYCEVVQLIVPYHAMFFLEYRGVIKMFASCCDVSDDVSVNSSVSNSDVL